MSAVLAFLAVPASAQDVRVLAGDSAEAAVAPSATVEVPILVDLSLANTDLASLDVRVTWDPALLTFSDTLAGEFGTLFVNDADTASGSYRANLFSADGTTDSFRAFGLILTAAALTELAETTVGVEVLVAGDEAGNTITGRVRTRPLALQLTTGETWGDPTGDARISALDALVCLATAVGLTVEGHDTTLCDVAPDGEGEFDGVTALDALAILTSVVGKTLPGNYRVRALR